MRSLFANVRGTTPDPIPVIRFRRDLVSHSAGSIPTGYDTSWQAGRLGNHSSNRLAPTSQRAAAGDHGAPPASGPLRAYGRRLTSFAALFRYAAFAKYHHQQTAETDPVTAEPTVHRLLPRVSEAQGQDGPPFRISSRGSSSTWTRCGWRNDLGSGLLYKGGRFVRDVWLVAGKKGRPVPVSTRSTAGTSHAPLASAPHHPSWFSPAQRRRRYPICIGWEGMLRICPHTLLSWPRVRGWIDAASSGKKGPTSVATGALMLSGDTVRLPKSPTIPHG
ncbi:hypothetical protein CKAH01_08767 [Colletotrichum kahawae]|uniref:Uncharacterized protein n=1 Tax=Colletotrichum kahawae TaxID=34407 RepID=A0AAD9Y045_COLKA|nr:hypothetical protein CKAH01_08767 [Colletotrichum kahawae]